MKKESEGPITVYFDGLCNVCNASIDFLIRHDRQRKMKYAPLQGKTAEARLPRALVANLNTMVFQQGDRIETDSTAALFAIATCGGIYSTATIFLGVPRVIRDAVYRWVAKHRYLFAGRRSTCRLPTAAERELFLD